MEHAERGLLQDEARGVYSVPGKRRSLKLDRALGLVRRPRSVYLMAPPWLKVASQIEGEAEDE